MSATLYGFRCRACGRITRAETKEAAHLAMDYHMEQTHKKTHRMFNEAVSEEDQREIRNSRFYKVVAFFMSTIYRFAPRWTWYRVAKFQESQLRRYLDGKS